jgi:hypothetical protein
LSIQRNYIDGELECILWSLLQPQTFPGFILILLPTFIEEIAEEAVLCRQNGATVLHTHAEANGPKQYAYAKVTSSSMRYVEFTHPGRMEVYREHADMSLDHSQSS